MYRSKSTSCLDCGHRVIYLDLIDNVEGIRIAIIREYYLDQGVCNAISAVGRSFKGIVEVGCGILDRSITTKDHKTRNADALTLGLDHPLSRLGLKTHKMSVITLTMPMPLDRRNPARV